jgi:glycosyltransferase involved in cell wall biosynthesis
MGVPAVLGDIGALKERVVDGVTGFLTRGEDQFAERAVQVLSDDALWMNLHRQCLAHQRARTWDHVAADFEALL